MKIRYHFQAPVSAPVGLFRPPKGAHLSAPVGLAVPSFEGYRQGMRPPEEYVCENEWSQAYKRKNKHLSASTPNMYSAPCTQPAKLDQEPRCIVRGGSLLRKERKKKKIIRIEIFADQENVHQSCFKFHKVKVFDRLRE